VSHPSRIGLVDTSVFIATESGRPLDAGAVPTELAASVVTLAELTAGVLAAGDLSTRAIRLATLARVRSFDLLPVTDGVAAHWARLRVQVALSARRVNINDLWIAATAAAHGLPIVTQDVDFDVLAEVGGIEVIRV
jgi:predicted nucleic acid-binding protein